MKKRILLMLVAAVLTLTLSGCSGFTLNVSELMRPPKAGGENAEIQELIDSYAGGDYTLKYPQNGSYRTAVTTVDLDGDSRQEAIAFYLPAGDAQTIHLLVMKETEDEWIVIGDHISGSTTVNEIQFADLDGDGVKEIAVGWSSYNSLINNLSFYLVSDRESTEIPTNYTYSSMLTGHFSSTDREQVMLLTLLSADKPATASLISINDTKNSIYTISEAGIDNDVVSFSQLLVGNVCDGQNGVVIDGVTAEGTYSTQILYYDKLFEELIPVSFTRDEPTNQATRSYAILSRDMDNDGVIEIPNAFKLPIDKKVADVVPIAMVYWCEYTSLGTLKIDKKSAASLVYGFYFDIPEDWDNNFTAYANFSTNEIVFCKWDSKNGIGEELLCIKMFTQKAFSDGVSAKGYTKLSESDRYVYAFKVPQSNSPMLLTNEEITERFTLMK